MSRDWHSLEVASADGLHLSRPLISAHRTCWRARQWKRKIREGRGFRKNNWNVQSHANRNLKSRDTKVVSTMNFLFYGGPLDIAASCRSYAKLLVAAISSRRTVCGKSVTARLLAADGMRGFLFQPANNFTSRVGGKNRAQHKPIPAQWVEAMALAFGPRPCPRLISAKYRRRASTSPASQLARPQCAHAGAIGYPVTGWQLRLRTKPNARWHSQSNPRAKFGF